MKNRNLTLLTDYYELTMMYGYFKKQMTKTRSVFDLFFRANSSYDMTDIEAQRAIMNAARWHPACCIGAIISTAAAWVVSEIADRIDG